MLQRGAQRGRRRYPVRGTKSNTVVWLPTLVGRDVESAWDGFLREYASIVLQVVQLFERDQDRIDDCFVFACQQLRSQRMRRLRKFDVTGLASFATWLRAVVRNLCLDWRRKRFGRPRLFRSIARLPELDQEVFRCTYDRRLTENETLHTLQPLFPCLTSGEVAESRVRIEQNLSPQQSWLLASRYPRLESLSGSRDDDTAYPDRDPADPAPDPENEATAAEEIWALGGALSRLSNPQRLLIRLRFEQGLSLEQIATVTGLGSALTVGRRIQKILVELKSSLEGEKK